MRVRVLAVLALVALLAVGVAGCGGTSAEPKARTTARGLPAATLQPFDRGPASARGVLDLRKIPGPAVVNLWASWCGPCKRELPVYQSFATQYAGKVRVIGIDFQDTRTDAARQLVDRAGVTYPLYADPDGVLRAIGLPKVLLVRADGTVAFEKYEEMTDPDQLADLVREHLPGVIS